MLFQLRSRHTPSGDQPQAIAALVQSLADGKRNLVLKGVTGSGKTFTMANVIAATQRPALILTHNKVLAKQLYDEFRAAFPENFVGLFISPYTHFVPESYRPMTDRHVDKFAVTDPALSKLRADTITSLLNRRDVIVVASVSCLFGLGSQAALRRSLIPLHVGQAIDCDELLRRLLDVHYKPAHKGLRPGKFFVDGETISIQPSFARVGWRVTIHQNKITEIVTIDIATGETTPCNEATVHCAYESVVRRDELPAGIARIKREAKIRIAQLRRQGQKLEAQRLATVIDHDMKLLQTKDHCSGLEDYAKVFSNSSPGVPTETLLSHLPDDVLVFIDESHRTIPSMRSIHKSDVKRKQKLVDHGFLLPSALDRRPLTLSEVEDQVNEIIFVSATPGPYELARAGNAVVEQQIRPTGFLDPEIEIEPSCVAVDHLTREIRQRAARDERTLVMTITKAEAENLVGQLQARGIHCAWMHSDLTPPQRNQVLAELHAGTFDALVGCNLLREGLDLPQVSLVAILSADSAGFLRDETSFIQMIGRAARHENGKAVLFADKVTAAMARAKLETLRRRSLQGNSVSNRARKQQGQCKALKHA